MENFIKVRGAKVHNLKNIDVNIPKNKLVVITGLSGSGKSSLAFDTIYAEGQRRYVESLSAYARQFLGMMEKPNVESIEGLSPAIAIDQKSASSNPRSTVGTITEIYDYLRLLFARVGTPFCYKCGRPIESQTVQEIVDKILNLPHEYNRESLRVLLLAPIVQGRKGEYEELWSSLSNKGFARVRVDGDIKNLDEEIKLEKTKKHHIEIVVDRLTITKMEPNTSTNTKAIDAVITPSSSQTTDPSNYYNQEEFTSFRQRITDSVETCLRYGNGEIIVNLYDEKKDLLFSENLVCKHDGISYPRLEPHSFSFNSPHGACPRCTGLGHIKEIDPKLIYNPELTISEGGIFPWSRSVEPDSWYMKQLSALATQKNFSLKTKIKDLPTDVLQEILYGSETQIKIKLDGNRFSGNYETKFEGVIPNLERKYRETDSEHVRNEIEKYMVTKVCPECNGSRLRQESTAIRVGGKNIVDVTQCNIEECIEWVESLTNANVCKSDEFIHRDGRVLRKIRIGRDTFEEDITLSPTKQEIARTVLREISNRLHFLKNVGLGYLTLNRTAKTLSGGEAQRIRLASQIGSGLSGVLYVLDEPSIGLHQRDNAKLIETLKNLRELGNTVLVVEHDEDTINNADWIIDMGEGAGVNGGKVVAQGTPEDIKKDIFSVTAPYINKSIIVGSKYIRHQDKVRKATNRKISVKGAKQNNLKNINIDFPLGKLVCVTGVSGSGKSTLVNDILYKFLHNHFYGTRKKVGMHDSIEGVDAIDKVIGIDQSPIGKTPRSNPATYIGFFSEIRNLFASTNEAKIRGYTPGRFSFNVKGGRCETCKGDGVIKIEMHFLPDVYVTCEACSGKRYNRETLEIEYKGKNIYDVLEMNVDEAADFFANNHKISHYIKLLQEVGLGYIKLGQQATTLSGGESQRIRLATELSKRSTGRTLYILDEPTTGLHFADVDKLLDVLHKLVERGNSVIVIEHNLDVIKTADWIIDLGPEGGDRGGEVVVAGTVEDVINCENSWTGQYLRKILQN